MRFNPKQTRLHHTKVVLWNYGNRWNIGNWPLGTWSRASVVNTTTLNVGDLDVLSHLERIERQFGPHGHRQHVCQCNGSLVVEEIIECWHELVHLCFRCFIIPYSVQHTALIILHDGIFHMVHPNLLTRDDHSFCRCMYRTDSPKRHRQKWNAALKNDLWVALSTMSKSVQYSWSVARCLCLFLHLAMHLLLLPWFVQSVS